MYARDEKAAIYQQNIVGCNWPKEKTATLVGNEEPKSATSDFPAYTTKQQLAVIYVSTSFVLLTSIWSEDYPWVSLILTVNFYIAARLANRALKEQKS